MITDGDYHGRLGRSVGYFSRKLWAQYGPVLQQHGIGWEDVSQQAWVECMVLHKEWPTNPTKYLQGRLIDWMRVKTGYHRKTKRGYWFQSFESLGSVENQKWEPEAPPVLYEMRDLLRRVVKLARRDGERAEGIVEKYLEGDTMSEIGKGYGITESRVSYIWLRTVKRATAAFSTMTLCLFFASMAWGQQPPHIIEACGSVAWDANTEDDLAGYLVYVKKDGVELPAISVVGTDTSGILAHEISCSELPMVDGHDYEVTVVAFDLSGNHSLRSESLVFTYKDVPPIAPKSICIDATVDGVSQKLCIQLITQ